MMRKRANHLFRTSLHLFVVVALAALVCAMPRVAWAEGDYENNYINPQQTPDSSFLYDTTIGELNVADSSYQDSTVQLVGEVMGDALIAEEDPTCHWILLNGVGDDDGSLSVLISDSDLNLIDTFGGYSQQGTVLRVRGTFFLSCPTHEGITDIHAETVTMVERGKSLRKPFEIGAFVPGIIACLVGLALVGVFCYLRERER